MATINEGTKGPSGGPEPSEPPFAVEQARRELKLAQDALKDAKKGMSAQQKKDLRDAVDRAQRQLDKLTKGSLEERRKARREYMEKYFDKMGGDWIQKLYEDFPDLRNLLERAIEKGWHLSAEGQKNFLDAFYKTDFYKNPNRGLSWFSTFQLEYGDPSKQKAFADSKRQKYDAIRSLADRYGVKLTDEQVDNIARLSLYRGWTDVDLDSYMANRFRQQGGDPDGGDGGDNDGGDDIPPLVGEDVATNEAWVRDLARSLGLTLDANRVRDMATKLTEARQNYSQFDARTELVEEAKKKYGAFGNLFGFVGANGGFVSLLDIVNRALLAGGDTARLLFENESIQAFLQNWLGGDGRSLAEVWNERLDAAKVVLRQEARTLGLTLDDATLNRLAREYQYGNWADNETAMREALVALVNQPDDTPGDGGDDDTPGDTVWDEGSQAVLERKLRDWARNYGVDLGNEWFTSWVNKIILSPADAYSETDALNEIIKLSRELYPVFSEQINGNVTVRDAAGGFLQRMARLLEIDTETIDLNDPLLQKALTGRDENGKPRVPSLYDFASMVRQDDRWQHTDNALSSYASTANSILQRMGFVG